jgi:hypothetical protein
MQPDIHTMTHHHTTVALQTEAGFGVMICPSPLSPQWSQGFSRRKPAGRRFIPHARGT